jgi:hypothetical protein
MALLRFRFIRQTRHELHAENVLIPHFYSIRYEQDGYQPFGEALRDQRCRYDP